MRHFAVAAIGRDMPGIVAAVSKVLLDHAGNIEDSQMTILRGHFTVMLIVSTPDETDGNEMRARLEEVRDRLGLEAISVNEVTEIAPEQDPVPSHILSVYGADHPGIVHAMSSALAERRISITDLNTRLVGEQTGESLYVMMLEIALPAGADADELRAALSEVGSGQAVEVTINPLEQDAL
jgi:glycine cleavage system transcriptional repressor